MQQTAFIHSLNLAHKDFSVLFVCTLRCVQLKPHCVVAKVRQTAIYIYYNHL